MDRFQEALRIRIKDLEDICVKVRNELIDAPKGTLRVSSSSHGIRYYHRLNKEKNSGTYIRKSQMSIARELARKDYLRMILKAARSEQLLLKEMEGKMPNPRMEDVYKTLSKERRDLTESMFPDDEEYAAKWQQQEYERKPFADGAPEYYTDRGERVRSKSEILLANQMSRMEIPYHYERPLVLADGLVIHPDFTVLHKKRRKELYLEHFGMMDDPDYCERAVERIHLYEKNGFFPGRDLVLTFETQKRPPDVRILASYLRQYFQEEENGV